MLAANLRTKRPVSEVSFGSWKPDGAGKRSGEEPKQPAPSIANIDADACPPIFV
ncbi:MAG: hypothetical protein KTR25_00170 [Myxococcales bacterium]|nr:hypothetical protein [Myxococcales bacterium]